jgi:hypothetical protein
MNKISGLILGCFALSIFVVVALLFMSKTIRQQHGAFLRHYPPHPVLEGDTLGIKYNTYYIAGGTTHTVYLGNYVAPLHILVVNMIDLDTQHVTLSVKGIFDQKFWSLRVKVDSPYFYVTDGSVPRIYRGNVNNWYAERFLFDSTYYREITPVNPDTYVVKTLRGTPPENVLGRVTEKAPHFIYNDGVLRKQVDGIFCTDGMLHFDKHFGKVVYLYYYRNEFFVLDTSLNLISRSHTLDTISKAQIEVATINSSDQYTLSTPPLFVNRRSSVYGNRLFVNSNIIARNESKSAFDQGEVIDVYDLSSGQYQFSFYIYNFWRAKRMVEFQVFGDRIFVVYEKLVRIYNMLPEYFPDAGKPEDLSNGP